MIEDFIIETERLKLIFLNIEDLESLLISPNHIEKKYNAIYEADTLNQEMLDVIKMQLLMAKDNKLHYIFHTLIMYLDKEKKVFVGSACFKNFPYDGRVEIGYGIGEKHRRLGYATEGVIALADWCLNNGYIPYLEVEKWNVASKKVANKSGFVIYDNNEISNFYEKTNKGE